MQDGWRGDDISKVPILMIEKVAWASPYFLIDVGAVTVDVRGTSYCFWNDSGDLYSKDWKYVVQQIEEGRCSTWELHVWQMSGHAGPGDTVNGDTPEYCISLALQYGGSGADTPALWWEKGHYL